MLHFLGPTFGVRAQVENNCINRYFFVCISGTSGHIIVYDYYTYHHRLCLLLVMLLVLPSNNQGQFSVLNCD